MHRKCKGDIAMKEMRVTRVQFIIFAALLLMFMIPQAAHAEVNGSNSSDIFVVQSQEGDITPVVYDQNGQARQWYYEAEINDHRVIYEPGQTVKDKVYLKALTNIPDVNGNYYIAEGYLNLVGTVYDFPNKNWVTGIYSGTVGCFIY